MIVMAMQRRWRVAKVTPSVWDQHPELPWRVFRPDGRIDLYAATFQAVQDFYTAEARPVTVAVGG